MRHCFQCDRRDVQQTGRRVLLAIKRRVLLARTTDENRLCFTHGV
jgi:hypothetical protein